MKLISSVVRPNRLDKVKEALSRARVYSLNVAEMHDHSPQKHETTVWMGHEYSVGFSIKLQIEVVVHDDDVDEVVGAIIRTARTGCEGDGHVLVLPVEHRYNIRDGLRDVS
jgi:nitrogen regulatory protein P-II 1